MERKSNKSKNIQPKEKNLERRDGKKPLVLAILFLLTVFVATQIRSISVKEKQEENNLKIEQLESEKAEEEKRKQELADYEAYIKTPEFIIRMAREKLNLVFENEIIFIPSDEE